MRIKFCGSIIGSVIVRKDETPEDALARAESALLNALSKNAKLFAHPVHLGQGLGPNVCLEIDDSED